MPPSLNLQRLEYGPEISSDITEKLVQHLSERKFLGDPSNVARIERLIRHASFFIDKIVPSRPVGEVSVNRVQTRIHDIADAFATLNCFDIDDSELDRFHSVFTRSTTPASLSSWRINWPDATPSPNQKPGDLCGPLSPTPLEISAGKAESDARPHGAPLDSPHATQPIATDLKALEAEIQRLCTQVGVHEEEYNIPIEENDHETGGGLTPYEQILEEAMHLATGELKLPSIITDRLLPSLMNTAYFLVEVWTQMVQHNGTIAYLI
ncbi:hypothetical protein DFH06DRAFT_1484173 [Mycena polygramma]|nr:hypothetical protein DFH06DRAFT_1484173 [Mycena polygramma]